jgi:hypothetical protein
MGQSYYYVVPNIDAFREQEKRRLEEGKQLFYYSSNTTGSS